MAGVVLCVCVCVCVCVQTNQAVVAGWVPTVIELVTVTVQPFIDYD